MAASRRLRSVLAHTAAPRAAPASAVSPLLGLRVQLDVEVPMRDGTLLRADLYRPAGDGAHPAILLRTPYGKFRYDGPYGGVNGEEFEAYVRAGYAVVAQDCRGRCAPSP